MLCSPHHSPVVGGPFILPTSTLSPQQILYSPQALPVPPLLLTTFNLLISECPPLSWMSPVNADEQNHRKGGVIRLHIYFTSRREFLFFCFPSGTLCVSERAVQVISRCHLHSENLLENNLQVGSTVVRRLSQKENAELFLGHKQSHPKKPGKRVGKRSTPTTGERPSKPPETRLEEDPTSLWPKHTLENQCTVKKRSKLRSCKERRCTRPAQPRPTS